MYTQIYRASLVAQEVKNPPVNAEDVGSIPGLGRYPGEENDNPLQYSCLGNPMDRGVWQATVHGVAKRVGHDLTIAYIYINMCVCVLSHFSRVQLFESIWTAARQAALSTGFSRQEYWSGLPCLLQGIFPTQ